MDKQKTQRIIGILVIIAFVIVLIPLFFGKPDISTEASTDKTIALPPQPETTTMVAKEDATEGQTPDDSAILGSATPPTPQQPIAQTVDSTPGNTPPPTP
jgi:hypothetical protein